MYWLGAVPLLPLSSINASAVDAQIPLVGDATAAFHSRGRRRARWGSWPRECRSGLLVRPLDNREGADAKPVGEVWEVVSYSKRLARPAWTIYADRLARASVGAPGAAPLLWPR
jgi:hypothetical protein